MPASFIEVFSALNELALILQRAHKLFLSFNLKLVKNTVILC